MAKKSSKQKGTIMSDTVDTPAAKEVVDQTAQEAAPVAEEAAKEEVVAQVKEEAPAPVVDLQAALGQVQEVVVEKAAPVQEAQPQNLSSNYAFEEKRLKAFESGNSQLQLAVSYLDTYLEDMKPNKPMTDEQGARHQTNFWRFLRTTINNGNENFNEVMSLIVDYFREFGEDSAFGDVYLYRFSHALTIGSEEVKAYFALLNVIKILSTSKDRVAAVRQIDIERTFGQSYSDQGRERIVNFITGNV